MSAVKQYAELFQEGWELGRKAAEGYPYPDESMDDPERVDQHQLEQFFSSFSAGQRYKFFYVKSFLRNIFFT